jgi:hypothetical protein
VDRVRVGGGVRHEHVHRHVRKRLDPEKMRIGFLVLLFF